MSRSVLAVLIVANLLGAAFVVVRQTADTPRPEAVARARPAVPVTAADTTTTTAPPSTTTTTTAPPPSTTTTTTTPAPAAAGLAAFAGLGTWVDVYDFSPAYMQEGEPSPVVTPEDVPAMAAVGVRTLYIQAARDDERTPGLLEQPALLSRFLVTAHEHGIRVVAWYLPKQYGGDDLDRLRAIRDFEVDGHRFDAIGLDIEYRGGVPDPAERNARLVELSRRLRVEVTDRPLAAIVVPPVVTDLVNPAFWPGFPWRELAPHYDVWMPMAYWTMRKSSSEWRDAEHYVRTNVAMVRRHVGRADLPVHPIGGIGDAATLDDHAGMVRAAHETASMGVSVYDYRTTDPAAWQVLRGGPGA